MKLFYFLHLICSLILVFSASFLLTGSDLKSFSYGSGLFSANLALLSFIFSGFLRNYQREVIAHGESTPVKVGPFFFFLASFKLVFLGLTVYLGLAVFDFTALSMVGGSFLSLLLAGLVGFALNYKAVADRSLVSEVNKDSGAESKSQTTVSV